MMKANNKITFDELDLKLLNELPLISEVLTATANKLAKFFAPIYQEIIEVCNKNIPVGWEIDKKQLENVFYPFSSTTGREKITSLENYFKIENCIYIVLRSEKKWINFIEVSFGLYYDEDYEYNQKPYFYFSLHRDPSPRHQGKLYPLSYYENIQSRFNELNFNIAHPDRGNEIAEAIELSIEINNPEKVISAGEIFTNEILLNYLKGVK